MNGGASGEGRETNHQKRYWLVATIREVGGYSQEALARELGVSFPTVNSWERGRSRPRRSHRDALESLAHSLGIRTDIAVLVIDDDPVACAVIEGLVKGSPTHAEVRSATDASEGLILCGALDPNILLLDIMMPDIDGFEVARRLQDLDLNHTAQIIFVTASTDPSVDAKAAEFGHTVLRKPISQEKIDSILARANSLQDSPV